jgi:cytochrome c oxidase accessory protein FixG
VDHRERGLGDCIDCTLCKQVCPTGIDIRDGLQYQCIGCAACIDVCDDVMDKMNYPRGLIRYTTENALEHQETRILRPRVLVYGTLLLVLCAMLAFSISQRVPVELGIIRDRGSLYRETMEGLVENIYTLKIVNMDKRAHRYQLEVRGLEELQLVLHHPEIEVPAGDVLTLPLSLRIDPVHLDSTSSEIQFTLSAMDDPSISITQTGRFIGPLTGVR